MRLEIQFRNYFSLLMNAIFDHLCLSCTLKIVLNCRQHRLFYSISYVWLLFFVHFLLNIKNLWYNVVRFFPQWGNSWRIFLKNANVRRCWCCFFHLFLNLLIDHTWKHSFNFSHHLLHSLFHFKLYFLINNPINFSSDIRLSWLISLILSLIGNMTGTSFPVIPLSLVWVMIHLIFTR
jgi:hypothetical protein